MLSYHVCEGGFILVCVHGKELDPVLEEASRIGSGVDNQATVTPSARFVAQGDLSFPLCYVITNVDDLNDEQVEQTSCYDNTVPHTCEAQCCATHKYNNILKIHILKV